MAMIVAERSASDVNQVVLDTDTWESAAAFRMEEAALDGVVSFYVRTDHLGLRF